MYICGSEPACNCYITALDALPLQWQWQHSFKMGLTNAKHLVMWAWKMGRDPQKIGYRNCHSCDGSEEFPSVFFLSFFSFLNFVFFFFLIFSSSIFSFFVILRKFFVFFFFVFSFFSRSANDYTSGARVDRCGVRMILAAQLWLTRSARSTSVRWDCASFAQREQRVNDSTVLEPRIRARFSMSWQTRKGLKATLKRVWMEQRECAVELSIDTGSQSLWTFPHVSNTLARFSRADASSAIRSINIIKTSRNCHFKFSVALSMLCRCSGDVFQSSSISLDTSQQSSGKKTTEGQLHKTSRHQIPRLHVQPLTTAFHICDISLVGFTCKLGSSRTVMIPSSCNVSFNSSLNMISICRNDSCKHLKNWWKLRYQVEIHHCSICSLLQFSFLSFFVFFFSFFIAFSSKNLILRHASGWEKKEEEEERADRNKSPSTVTRTSTFCYSRAWKPLTSTWLKDEHTVDRYCVEMCAWYTSCKKKDVTNSMRFELVLRLTQNLE